MQNDYALVRLRNGAHCVRSVAEDETFHPGIGPADEAEALYVRQLRLPERVRASSGEFVIWDVGLGAAANALTAIRLIRENLAGTPAQLRMVSFDQTSAAASFALEHAAELGYVAGYESALGKLVKECSARFSAGPLAVEWHLVSGDFPALLSRLKTGDSGLQTVDSGLGTSSFEFRVSNLEFRMGVPPPHAILFDPHSPRKNPAMWTVPLFADLFRALDPRRPCALATFTRSTMARAAMLLGGFFVGVGHPSGLKEETTVAANTLGLLDEPLQRAWLERARRSHSAEPLGEPIYTQAGLSPQTLARLREHPQWRIHAAGV
jgi:tRNA U34 5-methylaminomethyl-2-thiouridine-forming methyltransferase MnmC